MVSWVGLGCVIVVFPGQGCLLFCKDFVKCSEPIKHGVLNLVPTGKTSSLFVPLAVQIDVDCSVL